MLDTSYPPPNAAATMPGAAYPPPNVQPVVNEPSIAARNPAAAAIHSALINAGATPNEAVNLTAISGAESRYGRSPIGAPNKNGSQDFGAFQINNAAHPEMGGAAIANMPLEKQAALALQIARKRGGFQDWVTYNSGAYKKYLGGAGGAASASPPPSPSPSPSPFATPTVGNALAYLTQPPPNFGGQGQSPLQQAAQTMGGGGQQQQAAAPQPDLQGQQAAAALGQARQQQIAARAQQMTAAMRQQPLAWGSAPPGSMPGTGVGLQTQQAQADPQTMLNQSLQNQQFRRTLGTTLNSMGVDYNG